MTDKLKVTRDQLADFIDNHDTVKQFERLFDLVNTLKEPDVVTITDATNVVQSLPLASDKRGRRIYRRTGAGAGTFTLNTQNSEELILLNGTSVTTIVLSGEETLEVYITEGKLWVLIN
jgi:hypothetical protein